MTAHGAEADGFEQAPVAGEALVVDLGTFEGPIDLLLTLAREQKVDLARISILRLADQYLDFVARAHDLRLELAADYLVMAAWLAYLKSRLLLPPPHADATPPTAAEMAEALAFQLRRLEAMQASAVRLFARPKLGQEVFPRGAPEGITFVGRPQWTARLVDLLRAWQAVRGRGAQGQFVLAAPDLYAMDEAFARLERMLGRLPAGAPDGWQSLAAFLPPNLRSGVYRRSAIAATLSATLELAKSGRVELRQDAAFGPVLLRPVPEASRRIGERAVDEGAQDGPDDGPDDGAGGDRGDDSGDGPGDEVDGPRDGSGR
ncbi:MAG: segregation and condensation protein A [Alphaproteobacteria bacterium]